MNFSEIKSFLYYGNMVIIDTHSIEIPTPLADEFDAVQYNKGGSVLEEPLMTVVPESKYQYVIDEWETAFDTKHADRKQQEMAQDPAEYMRIQRDYRLRATDEWALSDRTITTAQTAYRQALRDLPDHATDWNPVVTWDDSDADRDNHAAVFSGVAWPTKP